VTGTLEHILQCNDFAKKVDKLVKKHCVSDAEFAELLKDTDLQLVKFLANVAKKERKLSNFALRKLMFTASQIQVFPIFTSFTERYECHAWNLCFQAEETIRMPDKILGRVLDQHNLGKPCFVGAVRCYWGCHGDFCSPVDLFAARKTVLCAYPKPLGIMKPIIYCAKRGNEPMERFAELKAKTIIHSFSRISQK
tara:strand:+ start:337 stop:921 length:585 start_codon:yes stop_codon:yes gene_type:complete